MPSREGATFARVLPVTAHVSPQGALSGLRVMLVDDDADSAEIFTRAIGDAGAHAVWEPSVAQALARLRQSPDDRPNVIVSDIGLPGEDGYSLLHQVRALRPEFGGTVPVIALTAYATPEDRARALRNGFEAHIAKPFDAEALIAVILRAAAP